MAVSATALAEATALKLKLTGEARLDAERVAAVAGDPPPQALADALHGSAVAYLRDGDPGWMPWSTRPGTARVFGGAPGTPDVVTDGYAGARPLVS